MYNILSRLSDAVKPVEAWFIRKYGVETAKTIRYKLQTCAGLIISDNLDYLGWLFRCDKATSHGYCQIYGHHFKNIRKRKLLVFEIGIGGYENPLEGGNSLRMWASYFRRSTIVGIDIQDKSFHEQSRIHTRKGSQDDALFLKSLIDEFGIPDIVIDDGSHFSNHVRKSFEVLFPKMKSDGIYCIEDLHTSYWPSGFCGLPWAGSTDIYAPKTSMSMIKRIIDSINIKDMLQPLPDNLVSDGLVKSVHCYRGLCLIYKGKAFDGESSNADSLLENYNKESIA